MRFDILGGDFKEPQAFYCEEGEPHLHIGKRSIYPSAIKSVEQLTFEGAKDYIAGTGGDTAKPLLLENRTKVPDSFAGKATSKTFFKVTLRQGPQFLASADKGVFAHLKRLALGVFKGDAQ